MSEQQYAGFWIRVVAALIDTVLILLIVMPLLLAIYGKEYFMAQSWIQGFWDLMLNYILPAIAVIMFWIYKSATPGKMVLGLKIVDAETGQKLSAGQSIGRYLGYYVAMLPLFLGLIWVGIDKRKQGLHDKLAGTVVIKDQK
jgi:uncharacterized RDD family membrane protein YckC